MTLPPDNDRVVTFLRRHRPVPPTASQDLEDQIMAVVQSEGLTTKGRRGKHHRWALPALAASLLLTWGGWVTFGSLTQPEAEMTEVETFLANTWYQATYGDEAVRLAFDTTEPDWLFSVYATPY